MFKLDLKSRISIYEQVINNLKELIITDVISGGDKLPSVRELSKSIMVNPNTVQKAYKELERDGFIYTTSGVGTFVSDKKSIKIDDNKINSAKSEILQGFNKLIYLGLTFDNAKEIVLQTIDERRRLL